MTDDPPRFATAGLRERLAQILDRGAAFEQPAVPGSAAVLAPLVPTPVGPCLLFERRPEGPSRFAGHLSFPGGRIEAADPTQLAAALRETEEEIGFTADNVEVLGHLVDTEDPIGRDVTCFVGLVPLGAIPDAAASPEEVDEIILVPLADLLEPAPRAAVEPAALSDWPIHAYRAVAYEARMLPSLERVVQYWTLRGVREKREATLWGFTGGLVALFLNRLFDWSPPRAPRIVADWADLHPDQ